jgi:hypothetical protein
MKKTVVFFIFTFILTGIGCDEIDNRTIEMDEVIPLKKVLLLDFTDQACPNCSNAGIEVAGLKEIYGDALIPVAVHASPRIPKLPLVTTEGNEYDTHFGTKQTGHPAGIIDGKLFPNYDLWGGAVLSQFNILSPLEITISAGYDETSREVSITSRLKGLKEIANAQFLLWIIEDNIIDKQLLPDGTMDNAYQHQHIFRAAVNDTWGEEISLKTDEEKELSHLYVLNVKWKPEDVRIIGFVYDATSDEVFDVSEIHLLK